eukprot:CAMPEP_0175792938 /NCGR_PEP_ID=MMETSP0097-20121207/83214_1 /TAXON_ID=311494 /ORGANISM="Alexandrium monilatum, Strain CCMP3105" /LENGTH=406 /DNA_ID=CAMNT_0017104121 /DNA_START=1 /DNA_END=1221 /DNA_ORIENTATION=+
MANCIFVAIQLEFITSEAQKTGVETLPTWSHPFELMFCVVFTLELILRLMVHGRYLFQSKDWAWTVFDGVVVFVSIFELVADSLAQASRIGNSSFFRSIRALRTTRAVRVVRVFRFFKELRTLILSILGSFKTLLWSAVMMILFWYVFGVMLTTATHEACTPSLVTGPIDGLCPQLQARFGSLRRSVISLYMSMAGGVDWNDFYTLDTVYKALFLVYLFFTMFGVLNIVTGVFVEAAKEAGQADRDMLIRSQLRYQDKYMRDMMRLFGEIDANGSGKISRGEFHNHLRDERALAYFEALKLDISDANTLFDLLDVDKSGEIDIEEFLSGCQRLKGESRALDLAVLRGEFLSWMGHLTRWTDHVDVDLARLADIQNDLAAHKSGVGATNSGASRNPQPRRCKSGLSV